MKIIATNKKAYFEYEIIDTFEAGIVLMGCEVKSIRQGHISLANSFIQVVKGEMWLKNCYIKTYDKTTSFCPDERQMRKLLMSKKEILKISSQVSEKGLSIVPLKVYFNNRNIVKLQIAVARGKKLYDKRKSIKERDQKRELARQVEQWIHSKWGRLGFDIPNFAWKSEPKTLLRKKGN